MPSASRSRHTTQTEQTQISTLPIPVQQRPRVHPPQLDGDVRWRYVGVKTRDEAAGLVDATGFRLYHAWRPDQQLIDPHRPLPLMVVYRDYYERCHHWPVRMRTRDYPPEYYVEARDGRAFATISDLLRSYDNWAYVDFRHETIDVFEMDYHRY